MKRKRFTALKVTLTAMMLTAALTSGAGSAYAADLSQEGGSEPTVTITPSPEITPELPLPTSTPKPTPVPKNGLLKEGKVYRYYVNNKPVRNKWKKINGKYYWFKSNGVAAHDGHYKIKGVFYLFNKNAQRIIPGKKSIVKVNGVKYFVDAKGRPVTGWNEFNGRMYYVHKNGKCATNETIGGIRFNKNGYASNLTQARCKLAARNFIARHSNANASNYEKFRSCFYYIMAYTNFVGYMDPTPQEFKTKDWVYKYSLQMFQNGLTGNCYGIASSVAAIAKELGYEPYVITIPEGHSFVMINGLYYDNMYGTLFGAATRPAYTIEHKIKF